VAIFRLTREPVFPDPALAEPSGLLAVGGDLAPERLLSAYGMGIFPWYEDGLPILWHSPDPRMVLFCQETHVSRAIRREYRRGPWTFTTDRAFDTVLDHCARIPRPGQDGTWITDEMAEAYRRLHTLGFAHSVECWDGQRLVGGLYGVSLGAAFFGESMFSVASGASKFCLLQLVQQMLRWDMDLVDAQVHTDHLERFGAREIPRAEFLDALALRLETDTRRGPWALDPDLRDDPLPQER